MIIKHCVLQKLHNSGIRIDVWLREMVHGVLLVNVLIGSHGCSRDKNGHTWTYYAHVWQDRVDKCWIVGKPFCFCFLFLLILFRLETIRVNLPPRFTRRHCLVASHSLGATGAAHTADKIVVTWSRSTGPWDFLARTSSTGRITGKVMICHDRDDDDDDDDDGDGDGDGDSDVKRFVSA